MKILHLMLANFFIDNYSYQENLITKYHKKLGYNVEIIASLFNFDENGEGYFEKGHREYVNEYQIPVTRLEYKKGFWNKKLRQYIGTRKAIEKTNPDIIFIHGCQFLDIQIVVEYLKENPHVKVYVDNHADFSNSATNWFSENVLHKIIWRGCAQLIEPYTTKYYGVLPARVDFLNEIYKIPQEKIELLVMGADDEKVETADDERLKEEIRHKYNILRDDFLIVTGGKIDSAKKQTLLLMEAVQKLANDKIKLIVFGSVVPELKAEIEKLVDGKRVLYIGWVESEETYKYFATADLVVFPGRHSVFWEQVVGQGIPMVVKWWEGTTHVDIGGNVKFLYEDSVEEIFKILTEIISNENPYNSMNKVATKGSDQFLYSNIARKSLE